ncbi:MAG: hypoxanthine phosphoribosyltransferase [Lentisphaeria bacterium]|nr:hypoxanthine phosphoribosyltransferase [Lentisphaeria bacterium]
MRILVTQSQIAQRVKELAAEITKYYDGEPLTVIVLMNGAMIFAADLVREIKLPLRWEAFSCSSYENDSSSGRLKVRSELKNPVTDRHLLIVDDVLDRGFTLLKVTEFFKNLGPLSVRTCVLLNKNVSGRSFSKPDWTGFVIPDHYVVGYGLDSNEEWRNLPYIAVKE